MIETLINFLFGLYFGVVFVTLFIIPFSGCIYFYPIEKLAVFNSSSFRSGMLLDHYDGYKTKLVKIIAVDNKNHELEIIQLDRVQIALHKLKSLYLKVKSKIEYFYYDVLEKFE